MPSRSLRLTRLRSKWVPMFRLILDSVAIRFICFTRYYFVVGGFDRSAALAVDLHYRESEIRKLFRMLGKCRFRASCIYSECEISEIGIF